MVSKYFEDVFTLVEKAKIKSTYTLLKEIEFKSKKKIGWHRVYVILRDLERENRIECIKTKHSFFWRKK